MIKQINFGVSTLNSMNEIVYIHGFLGESNECHPYEGLSLYDLLDLKDEDVISFLNKKYSRKKIAIGYSMGGRFILKYYESFFERFEKIYLLGANPGLSDNLEIQQRKIFSQKVNQELDGPDFLRFWNSLEIFDNDSGIKNLSRENSEYKKLFNRYLLEKEKSSVELIKSRNNVFLVHGQYDLKYKKLYSNFNQTNIVIEIPNTGHRLNKKEMIDYVLDY